ncbi:MAG: anhydro-N-acetylmuramic acid kinase [Halioglobus sp.]|jgi:anhydro-N-acetylmuramic acid kinase
MSGTSVDAIDAALLQCGDKGHALLSTHQHPIPSTLRKRIISISHTGPEEIERMGELDRDLGLLFADATNVLLENSGTSAQAVLAIGSHGQTIRHRPPSAPGNNGQSFTLQIGDPSTIAERTGITTVADFRRRDIAAGGEGAPLAPSFHAAAFAKANVNRAIVNIGGIANISLLLGESLSEGFDTGPGNTLLDAWISRHTGDLFDRGGQWAASGKVDSDLLQQLLHHPYFKKSGPRSTGKEAFNLNWLDEQLSNHGEADAVDIQATLTELTVASISQPILECAEDVAEIYLCGGGAHNLHLVSRLSQQLAPRTISSTALIGMDPDWVEAATFAWLAKQTLEGLSGNSEVVTGASGPRVLGGIYQA